jgi:hypothetical protein
MDLPLVPSERPVFSEDRLLRRSQQVSDSQGIGSEEWSIRVGFQLDCEEWSTV